MAKKSKGTRPGKTAMTVWFDDSLHEALAEYVNDSDPKTSATAVLQTALSKWLESVGRWPSPADKKDTK